MAEHVADLVKNQTGFAHITFERTFLQVEQKGSFDFFFMAAKHKPQAFQGSDAKRDLQRRSGMEKSTLAVDFFFDFIRFHKNILSVVNG